MLDRVFFEHPRSVGETYGEHLWMAGGFGVSLIKAGCACLIHAVFPRLCTNTASQAVKHLHDRMVVTRKHRQPEPVTTSASPAA